MPRRILIISSTTDKNCLLTRLFKELSSKNFSFSLWSSGQPLLEQFRRKGWPAQKIFLGPELKTPVNLWLFIFSLIFIQLKFLPALIKLKINQLAETIICLNLKEKIIITAPARLLGLKVVWLESPAENYRTLNKILFWLFRLNSRLAGLVVFNDYAESQLVSLKCRQDNIVKIAPGIELPSYQENIFNKLATSRADFHRKYFTVGVITPLNQRQKIETIFQAVKISLPVIPNLQLIIIGEGEERKNLLWLAKKMEIENLLWLVGEQEQLKKWLDSFDIFLIPGDNLKLDDYGNIIEAMAAGLPVLAPRNTGAENLVVDNKTGSFVETGNSEMLAHQIIKLHQDKKLRLFLGQNGRERAAELFTLEKMAAELEKIL